MQASHSDMRGGSFLKADLETQRQAFRDSQRLFDVANILRTAKSVTELTSLWDAYASDTRGDVQDALREVYAEVLKGFGVGVA